MQPPSFLNDNQNWQLAFYGQDKKKINRGFVASSISHLMGLRASGNCSNYRVKSFTEKTQYWWNEKNIFSVQSEAKSRENKKLH